MQDFNPLVTVAMCVYKPDKHLKTAVMSIVNQTYSNWELLIVIDDSNDDPINFLNGIDDKRIKIIYDGVNKGHAARLNEIINLANGDFIARMDQDDIAYPDRFMLQIRCFKKKPNLDLVSGRVICISHSSKPMRYLPFDLLHKDIVSRPWNGFYFPHPTWMGKISWFKKYKYADPAPYSCEDQELLLRSYLNSKFESVNQIVLAYRIKNSISFLRILRVRWSLFKVSLLSFYRKKNLFFIAALFFVFFIKLFRDLFAIKLYSSSILSEDLNVFNKVLYLNEK